MTHVTKGDKCDHMWHVWPYVTRCRTNTGYFSNLAAGPLDKIPSCLIPYRSDIAHQEVTRNHGIWAPDSVSCDMSKTRKYCKLPTASKLYSWGQRVKEIWILFYLLRSIHKIHNTFPIGLEYRGPANTAPTHSCLPALWPGYGDGHNRVHHWDTDP